LELELDLLVPEKYKNIREALTRLPHREVVERMLTETDAESLQRIDDFMGRFFRLSAEGKRRLKTVLV
jgi:hypothetical protein